MAEEEVTRLQEFAQSEGFTDKLQMWDLPYWRRRQRDHLFKYLYDLIVISCECQILFYNFIYFMKGILHCVSKK